MAYVLETDEAVRGGIIRCGREQLDRAVSELSSQIAKDPVKAVHSARKAVKRERALLRLVRGSMPADQRRRENGALRDASRELSGARDAEAMLDTLNALAERYVGQLPQRTFDVVSAEFERRRDVARAPLLDSTLADQAAGELLAVRVRVDDWELRRDGFDALEDGLHRSYRDGRRAFATARADRSMGAWHEWRKRAKDLWYQQRLLRSVAGPAVGGRAKDAHLLSDLLGDIHDLGVLRWALTEKMHAPVDSDGIVELIDHRSAQLQEEALCIGARVYAERPKQFMRRLRRMWKAGSRHARVVAAERPVSAPGAEVVAS
ncbi:MAG TPA: CHAD domain-containing protein [Solirubrobacteraceae bacterium]|nr:CHAD domain-containing protein [Solirubrobacteraceae bacterium]